MANIIGYARVSSDDQDCAIQKSALTAAGCNVVRWEKRSGTARDGRTELETILAFLQPGDALVVTRIDRLARSVRDLEDIVAAVRQRGADLRATEQPVDTSTPAGKAFLQMLGVFAEFETALRRERQMEGIAKAKAAGVYKGRKPSVDRDRVKAMAANGLGATGIAKALGIGRASVYRVLTSD
jgi:DNA invertase Pin-like site-specific DNA recombinase